MLTLKLLKRFFKTLSRGGLKRRSDTFSLIMKPVENAALFLISYFLLICTSFSWPLDGRIVLYYFAEGRTVNNLSLSGYKLYMNIVCFFFILCNK